jgi:hypothetical protein
VTAAALAQEARPALAKLGWVHSRQAKRPVDADWNPIPWYTYPAIAFLEPRLKPDFTVFEYGSGLSTVWWATRVRQVAAVEHDERWLAELSPQLPENADVRFLDLEPDGEYARAAAASEHGPFDLVVIDGRDRVNCALNAVPALSERGVIVWDNADRSKYRPGHRFLAQQGFRRVPFIGMGARIARVWDTSIFYRDDNCLGL